MVKYVFGIGQLTVNFAIETKQRFRKSVVRYSREFWDYNTLWEYIFRSAASVDTKCIYFPGGWPEYRLNDKECGNRIQVKLGECETMYIDLIEDRYCGSVVYSSGDKRFCGRETFLASKDVRQWFALCLDRIAANRYARAVMTM